MRWKEKTHFERLEGLHELVQLFRWQEVANKVFAFAQFCQRFCPLWRNTNMTLFSVLQQPPLAYFIRPGLAELSQAKPYRASFPSPSFGGDAPRCRPSHPPLHHCHTHVGGLLWPFPISSAYLPLHACAS